MNRPDRAQSEVIGVVLLLGLTITAVGITVGLGSTALADVQSSADVQRIEGAMTQVDSKASLVAHGGSTSQRVRLDPSQDADVRVDGEAGEMRIEVETEDGTDTKNVTPGAVVYERGDDRVAYQGGGVWRSNGDGSWMVSPPEFHYRGDTLTLPLVTIEGNERLGDSAVVTGDTEHPEGLFPSENVSNPLLGGNVTVTVESEYAEAWGRFFETRTSANVTQLSPTEVRVALRTETVHPTLSTGVSSVGRTDLRMGGIRTLYADSYDPADGPYDSNDSNEDATVQTSSEFRLTSGGGGNTESVEIRGDLVAESYNIPPGQEDKLTVTGEMRTDDSLSEPDPVSGAITQRMDRIRDENLASEGAFMDGFEHDNGSTMYIDQDTYVNGDVEVSDGSTLRIEEGATVHISGDLAVSGASEVVFDSTDGDIAVLAESELAMQDTAAIRSVGGNRNELFVDGAVGIVGEAEITTDDTTRFELYNTGDANVEDQATIAADGDVTRNLWWYSSAENLYFEGDQGDGIDFAGVLYAPTSGVDLQDAMTFKGSFTSSSFEFDDADLSLHYDESLQNLQPFGGESVPVVSHLHVSKHRVTIESD
jgi:flagellin-like protein